MTYECANCGHRLTISDPARDVLSEALRHARRTLITALEVNAPGYDASQHIVVTAIDAALAQAGEP